MAKTKAIQDPTTGRMMGSEKECSPDQIRKQFVKYKKWVDENPIIKKHPNPKTGGTIDIEIDRPLTQNGFYIWLKDKGVTGNGHQIFLNWEGRYAEFVEVCEYIKSVIRDNQLVGAMTGIYHHNLTAMLLGLAQKKEVKTDNKIEIDFSDE